MAKPVAGDVIVVPFPQTDLNPGKRRPALVLVTLPGDDLIVCAITSQRPSHGPAVTLHAEDFSKGRLELASYVRPARLFTIEQSVVLYVAATVRAKS